MVHVLPATHPTKSHMAFPPKFRSQTSSQQGFQRKMCREKTQSTGEKKTKQLRKASFILPTASDGSNPINIFFRGKNGKKKEIRGRQFIRGSQAEEPFQCSGDSEELSVKQEGTGLAGEDPKFGSNTPQPRVCHTGSLSEGLSSPFQTSRPARLWQTVPCLDFQLPPTLRPPTFPALNTSDLPQFLTASPSLFPGPKQPAFPFSSSFLSA